MSRFCRFCISKDRHFIFSLLAYQLSQKGSLPVDGQAATPASVSSAEAPSQQTSSDVTATLEAKVEDEEEEVDGEEPMMGGRTGKKGDIKAEAKTEVKHKEIL